MSYETWQGKRYDDEQSVSSATLFTYESEHGLKYGVERMDIIFRYLKGYGNLPQILKNILGTMDMQREKLSFTKPLEHFKASEKQLNVFRDHFSRYGNRSALNDILINCTPQFAELDRKRQRAIDRVVFEDEFASDSIAVTQELLRVRKELEVLKKAVADNATFKVKQVAVIALDDADFVKWYCSTDEINPSINYIKITKVSEAIVLHNEGFSSDIVSTLSGLNHKQHRQIMEVFNPPQKRKVLKNSITNNKSNHNGRYF